MSSLIPSLIVLCFAFATGFFLVLSYIEKPVWPLMFNPESAAVADADARLVHAELKRIIKLAPPTMMTAVGSGTLFILVQTWQRSFDGAALTMLGVLVLGFSYILVNLFRRIKAVEDMPSDGDITAVRDGLGKLAAIHHAGLVTVGSLALLQLLMGGMG